MKAPRPARRPIPPPSARPGMRARRRTAPPGWCPWRAGRSGVAPADVCQPEPTAFPVREARSRSLPPRHENPLANFLARGFELLTPSAVKSQLAEGVAIFSLQSDPSIGLNMNIGAGGARPSPHTDSCRRPFRLGWRLAPAASSATAAATATAGAAAGEFKQRECPVPTRGRQEHLPAGGAAEALEA